MVSKVYRLPHIKSLKHSTHPPPHPIRPSIFKYMLIDSMHTLHVFCDFQSFFACFVFRGCCSLLPLSVNKPLYIFCDFQVFCCCCCTPSMSVESWCGDMQQLAADNSEHVPGEPAIPTASAQAGNVGSAPSSGSRQSIWQRHRGVFIALILISTICSISIAYFVRTEL